MKFGLFILNFVFQLPVAHADVREIGNAFIDLRQNPASGTLQMKVEVANFLMKELYELGLAQQGWESGELVPQQHKFQRSFRVPVQLKLDGNKITVRIDCFRHEGVKGWTEYRCVFPLRGRP